ncbi:hypothetical protein CEQ90_11865 [Lewinellaceae bacterium SD302]|nr:hypothetical protein CEQ90_11865 [Lewinellaceae bacterium SD302]
MLRSFLLLLNAVFFFGSVSAQTELNVYRFEQLDSLRSIEDRPVVVFLNTDWCRYCRKMENVTFQDEWIATTLNEHCYFVNQNAEQPEPITYRGKTFNFRPTGNNTGVHELAEILVLTGNSEEPATITEGNVAKLSFPTTVILGPGDERIFLHKGYLGRREMRAVLESLLDLH